MEDIRTSFYQAIDRANAQPVKKAVRKSAYVEEVSFEDQIRMVMNESCVSAVTFDEVEVENDPLVEWMLQVTKKDEATILREQREARELEELNALREIRRKEYNEFNRKNEAIGTSDTTSSSSAAAGAGGGAGGGLFLRKKDDTDNEYVENDYVQNYLV